MMDKVINLLILNILCDYQNPLESTRRMVFTKLYGITSLKVAFFIFTAEEPQTSHISLKMGTDTISGMLEYYSIMTRHIT
jgi:hypothetical protein